MADISVLSVVMRWMHIMAAIMAVGGTIFAAFVVLPATEVIPQESRPHFHEAIRRRSSKIVMIAILLFIVSGFYNYIFVQLKAHHGQTMYNAMMGIKILLAFVVFFIASALTGKSKAFEPIRNKRKRWMRLYLLLAMAIIAIGAVLRYMPLPHA